MTGRISAFIPFVPFSSGEQSIVAHKYALELAERVRVAVDMSYGDKERLLGNVYLKIRRDASVCSLLAAEGYDEDLGARSLINTVKHVVEEPVVEAYLEVNKEIVEGQAMMEFQVSILRGKVTVMAIPQENELNRLEDEEDSEEDEGEETEDDD